MKVWGLRHSLPRLSSSYMSPVQVILTDVYNVIGPGQMTMIRNSKQREVTDVLDPAAHPVSYKNVYEDTCRALEISIVDGAGSFGLQDIATIDVWSSVLSEGYGTVFVGGALQGAMSGLRRLGALPFDVERCSLDPRGGAVTKAEMALAREWIASGLRAGSSAEEQRAVVISALAARGWLSNAVKVTSLVLALYFTASQAAERAKNA